MGAISVLSAAFKWNKDSSIVLCYSWAGTQSPCRQRSSSLTMVVPSDQKIWPKDSEKLQKQLYLLLLGCIVICC